MIPKLEGMLDLTNSLTQLQNQLELRSQDIISATQLLNQAEQVVSEFEQNIANLLNIT